MSTTRFWGETDDGVNVRHAEGGPLYEIGVFPLIHPQIVTPIS